jgi:hypothetical protein
VRFAGVEFISSSIVAIVAIRGAQGVRRAVVVVRGV